MFARTGATTGKSFLIHHLPEPTVFASYLIKLDTWPEFPPEYLAFYFKSPDYWRQITTVKTGTAQPGVNANVLSQLEIPLPPLNEQRRIVAKLEELFARTRSAREALEAIPPLLERYRQSVLAAAFRGDLTREWREKNPDVEPASVLMERIRHERQRQSNEERRSGRNPELGLSDLSNLEDLPKRWAWASGSQIGWVQLGRQRSPDKHHGPNMIPYLRAANVCWNGLDLTDVKTMQFSDEEVSRFRLRCGDILLGEASGSRFEVGKPGLWADQLPVCCFQNTLIRVRPVMPSMADYLFWHFFADAYSGRLGNASKGVGIHHIGAERLQAWPMRIPPLAEQQVIAGIVKFILEKCEEVAVAQMEKLLALSKLDQSILSKAFRGELVRQDPNDEPASVLLEQVRAERAAAASGKLGRKRKGGTQTNPRGMPVGSETL